MKFFKYLILSLLIISLYQVYCKREIKDKEKSQSSNFSAPKKDTKISSNDTISHDRLYGNLDNKVDQLFITTSTNRDSLSEMVLDFLWHSDSLGIFWSPNNLWNSLFFIFTSPGYYYYWNLNFNSEEVVKNVDNNKCPYSLIAFKITNIERGSKNAIIDIIFYLVEGHEIKTLSRKGIVDDYEYDIKDSLICSYTLNYLNRKWIIQLPASKIGDVVLSLQKTAENESRDSSSFLINTNQIHEWKNIPLSNSSDLDSPISLTKRYLWKDSVGAYRYMSDDWLIGKRGLEYDSYSDAKPEHYNSKASIWYIYSLLSDVIEMDYIISGYKILSAKQYKDTAIVDVRLDFLAKIPQSPNGFRMMKKHIINLHGKSLNITFSFIKYNGVWYLYKPVLPFNCLGLETATIICSQNCERPNSLVEVNKVNKILSNKDAYSKDEVNGAYGTLYRWNNWYVNQKLVELRHNLVKNRLN